MHISIHTYRTEQIDGWMDVYCINAGTWTFVCWSHFFFVPSSLLHFFDGLLCYGFGFVYMNLYDWIYLFSDLL